jgi:hypothetical protein
MRNKWLVLVALLAFMASPVLCLAESFNHGYVVAESGYQVGSYDNPTRVTVISSAGEVTNAVAKADGMAYIGPGDVMTSGGTYTITRGAANNWYLAKTAASDTTYISADITGMVRTAASKGLKLTAIKVLSDISTAALDNNYLTLSTVTYNDNAAPTVASVAVTGAQLGLGTDTAGQPDTGTVTVTTPAFQNTDVRKWAIELFIDSTTNANAVYRFYGMFLYFTHDYM